MQGTRAILIGLVGAALAIGGCGERAGEHDHGGTGDAETHEHAPGETHEHAADETHEGTGAGGVEGGGDHGHEHDAAIRHDLGSAAVGAYEVRVARYGDLTPGQECDVDISLGGGAAAAAAVRVWIGVEDGSGSMKARAEAEGEGFHAHVEAPDPMPQDARLWVEVESADGQTSRGSFALGG
jgi:hypothetical protein